MGKSGKPLPKLKYFSAYGLGEPIRLALNYCGVSFDDHRFKERAESVI